MKKYTTITAFILIFIFNSCLDQGYDFEIHQADEIALAKNWFTTQLAGSAKQRPNSRLGVNEPVWNNVNYFIKKDIEIFEIPLTASRNIVSLGEEHLIEADSKLIIFKRKMYTNQL